MRVLFRFHGSAPLELLKGLFGCFKFRVSKDRGMKSRGKDATKVMKSRGKDATRVGAVRLG